MVRTPYRAARPRPSHRISFSLLLLYFFSPSSFSPSPSPLLLLSFAFSLLLLSSLPLPGKEEEEEKKAPRRGGVWGGAPVFKWFPQKARRKKKTFKRRDKGESQMKLNNPPAVSSATDSRWRRDVASTAGTSQRGHAREREHSPSAAGKVWEFDICTSGSVGDRSG